MKQNLLLIGALVCCMTSFANKHKISKKKPISSTEIASPKLVAGPKTKKLLLCNLQNTLQPSWYLALPLGFAFPSNFPEPKHYRTLSTNDTLFSKFLKTVPFDSSKAIITLPVYIDQVIECKEFIIERTHTMDDVLQAKYPDLMSFRAYTTSNQLNAARIECDGKSVTMMITYDQKKYFVSPVNFKGAIYYVCYSQEDAGAPKQNFETR